MKTTHIAFALSLAFIAAGASAQVSPNAIRANSITTDGTVAGAINQAGGGGVGVGDGQTVSVAGVSGATNANNIKTKGSVVGAINQTKATGVSAGNSQLVSVGGVQNTKARNITEPAERAALYEQAQVLFNQDQPWINVVHPMLFTARRSNVEGYILSPLTNNNFATTQVK